MKKGIDVSYWNGIIDWKRVKNAGIDFAIIRLGYRTTLDTQALYNIREAKKHGIKVAVYWFLYWDRATIEQNAQACAEYMRSAELALDATWVFTDLEYDSWDKAKERCTRAKCSAYMKQFINALKSQGIKKIGIYCNNDYFKNYINWNEFNGYPIWLADYSGGADYDCIIQQYSSHGRVGGIDGNVDMNYLMQDDFFSVSSDTEKVEETKMGVTAKQILDTARGWLGYSESNGKWWEIVDGVYNNYIRNHRGAGRGYILSRSDAWCDCFVSSLFIKNNAVSLIGDVECGCPNHIQILRGHGLWLGLVRPQAGDLVFFDWGLGRSEWGSDHIGIVESVNGNTITTIEGNKNNSVSRRTIAWNDANICGYARPKYGKAETTAPVIEYDFTTKSGKAINKTKLYEGKVVSDTLNVRKAPDVSAGTCSFSPLKKNTLIDVCDEMKNGWLYVKNDNNLYGFVSGQYVVREGEKKPVAENIATDFTAKDKSLFTLTGKGTPNMTEKAVAKITASMLNVRTWAGTEFPNIKSYPTLGYGNLVSVCDSIADADGDTWLYVKIADKYYGFISADYVELQ